MNFKLVEKIAKAEKWEKIKSKDPYLMSFRRYYGGHPALINVWIGKKGVTVGTYIKHPIKGKSQLFRKHINEKLMKAIFKNPRVHTKDCC